MNLYYIIISLIIISIKNILKIKVYNKMISQTKDTASLFTSTLTMKILTVFLISWANEIFTKNECI